MNITRKKLWKKVLQAVKHPHDYFYFLGNKYCNEHARRVDNAFRRKHNRQMK